MTNSSKSPLRPVPTLLFALVTLMAFCVFFPSGLRTILQQASDIHAINVLQESVEKAFSQTGIDALDQVQKEVVLALTPTSRLGDTQTAGLDSRHNATQPLLPIFNPNATAQAMPIYNGTISGGKKMVLLTGDSMMMEGLGPALLRSLRQRDDISVRREAVYSTGLCRRDYFDWPKHMNELVDKYTPNLVVICLGGNDAQDIVDENKKRHHVGTASWQEQYRLRAEELAAAAQKKGATLIWVGLPIIGREPQAANTKLLTAQQKLVCQKNGTKRHFVDTYKTLADKKGQYNTFLQNDKGQSIRARAKDMVHVTEAGGQLLAQEVLPVINKLFPYVPQTSLTTNSTAAGLKATPTTFNGTLPVTQKARAPQVKKQPPAKKAQKNKTVNNQ